MVLEAWQGAEKVWFQVVWEEKKDASNIIDYDIHEEITIDTSSAFNANNDTTTGMATVIPWVNAPKLLESTSIYNNAPSKTAYSKSSASVSMVINQWDVLTGLLRPITIQDQWWAYTYTVWDYFNWSMEIANACIVFPASWIYQIECRYYSKVNIFGRSYDVYINLDQVYHLQNDNYYSQTWSAYPTETFYVNANKGDQIAIYYTATCTWWWTWNSTTVSVSMNITKVW